MRSQVFSGTMPALMTPCGADRRPDFDALVRTGRQLVDAGMSALVYCGSMGDWPLLTLEQRMQGVERLVDAGLPVIVGTGAQNTAQAAELARHAKKVGARGLMIIPRVLSRGSSPAAQRSHFGGVLAAAVDLPSVIYNSPYYGFQTRAELFFDLRREFPHLVGFKEFGGAESLSYAAEHIAGQSDDIALMVGVDTQVFHGVVNCGASGVDHRHRQRAAARGAAPRRTLSARRQGRRRGAAIGARARGRSRAALGLRRRSRSRALFQAPDDARGA